MKKKYTDIENQIRDNLISLKKKHTSHIDFLIIESKISKWILLTLTLSILEEFSIKDFSIVWYTFNKNYYNCIHNKNITNVISKFYSSEINFKNYINNMSKKFDLIIMNPPYGTNTNPYLHNKLYNLCCDFSQECISLMPCGKLQTPRLLNDKILNETRKRTKNIQVIYAADTWNYFNIHLAENLGIFHFVDGSKTEVDWELFAYKNNIEFKNICHKIYPLTDTLANHKSKKAEEFSFRLTENHGNPGKKDEFDLSTKISDKTKSKLSTSHSSFFNFNSNIELINFEKSLHTSFMKFIRMIERNSLTIYLQMYPWVGNIINPRTGLKGYLSDWISQDFYMLYNITENEQRVIEEVMSPYMSEEASQ